MIVADYKTGTVPEAARFLVAYVTQMALYRVSSPSWDKQLRMLLVFTAGPNVVELQAAALDAALLALR